MRFNKLEWLLVLGLATGAVHANEKKEEGGGGEHGGGGAEATSKEAKEFAEKSARLATLATKIEEAEKRFRELVHEKNETGSIEHKQAAIKEMVTLTKERNANVQEFNKLKTEVTYRYPYQGEKLNRRYDTQSERTVEELEHSGGLDEQLTRTKKLVDKKFAPFLPKEEKLKPKSQVTEAGAEKRERLRLEK